MKNFNVSVFALLTILLMSASCAKEQSELTLSSLPSTAIIKGNVIYDAGFAEEGGELVSNNRVPAVGQRVRFIIDTEEYTDPVYTPGIDPSDQYFETITDENGNYSMEIPVSSWQIEGSITVEPFYADRVILMNNQPWTVNSYYNNVSLMTPGSTSTTSNRTLTLTPGSTTERTLYLTTNSDATYENDQEVTIQGKVLVEAWVRNPDETEENSGLSYMRGTAPAANVEVTITATYGTGSTAKLFKVKATTNTDGEYSAKMMLPTNCWSTTTSFGVAAQATLHTGFVHRYCYRDVVTENQIVTDASGHQSIVQVTKTVYPWQTQEVEVIYNGNSISNVRLTTAQQLIPLTISDITMETTPVTDKSELYGVGLWELQLGAKTYTIPIGYSGYINNNALDW